MKYFKKLKIYKNSTGSNTFYPETLEAYSFEWWKYLAVIRGQLVFNEYNYSISTCKHQNDLRRLLVKLNIDVDVYVSVRSGLQNFKYSSLEPFYKKLFESEILIKTAKNKHKHAEIIKEAKDDIKKCRELGAVFTKDQIKKLKKEVEREIEYLRAEKREKSKKINEIKKQKLLLIKNLEPISFRNDELNSLKEINF